MDEPYFFPDTAYNLVGFYRSTDDILYALVEQNYIQATQATDLDQVKEFMQTNGFINTKNNDYSHLELGVILEDLHDENVLTANAMLYFIDTVFYIKPKIFLSVANLLLFVIVFPYLDFHQNKPEWA